MIAYSASDLVKRSAKQICHFLHKPELKSKPSAQAVKGAGMQEEKSLSPFREMRGIFTHKDIKISFCHDEIRQTGKDSLALIEHKWVRDDYEEWYLQYSWIQTALYGALTTKCDELKTASFYVIQGNPRRIMDIKDKKLTSYLFFGEDVYEIEYDAKEIGNYYYLKARNCADYQTAQAWDDQFKFKDWSYLERHIDACKLLPIEQDALKHTLVVQ